ncbi:MAG: hypothetical protein OEL53_00580 [Rhodospirillales bacterium]|nr:hypothetical protein [Rhodospirillales bacterium]
MLDRLRRLLPDKLAISSTRKMPETSDGELSRLEARLREQKQKTEQLAKISYAKWKLRKEQEKEYSLKYGVTLPLTSVQREQDEFFSTLESRLENERLNYLESQKAIEFQGREEERDKQERESAECVLKVLDEDLS